MELSGKHAVVTGGAGGLGLAFTRRLIECGATVSAFDIDDSALAALAAEHPGVHVERCDVTSPEQICVAFQRTLERAPPVDVVVNNAGLIHSAPLLRITPAGLELHDLDEWERVLRVNLSSVFYVTRQAAEGMVKRRVRGVIVNISSVCAAGNAGQSAYSAAKAGVNALTRTWAKELGLLGIRVAGLSPGYVEAPATRANVREDLLADVIKQVPLRRLGTPDEVASGLVWILENDYFHGKVLELDGGLAL